MKDTLKHDWLLNIRLAINILILITSIISGYIWTIKLNVKSDLIFYIGLFTIYIISVFLITINYSLARKFDIYLEKREQN